MDGWLRRTDVAEFVPSGGGWGGCQTEQPCMYTMVADGNCGGGAVSSATVQPEVWQPTPNQPCAFARQTFYHPSPAAPLEHDASNRTVDFLWSVQPCGTAAVFACEGTALPTDHGQLHYSGPMETQFHGHTMTGVAPDVGGPMNHRMDPGMELLSHQQQDWGARDPSLQMDEGVRQFEYHTANNFDMQARHVSEASARSTPSQLVEGARQFDYRTLGTADMKASQALETMARDPVSQLDERVRQLEYRTSGNVDVQARQALEALGLELAKEAFSPSSVLAGPDRGIVSSGVGIRAD